MEPAHLLLVGLVVTNAVTLAAWLAASARASAREQLYGAVGQAVGVAIAALLGPHVAARLQQAAAQVPEIDATAGLDATVKVQVPNKKEN